jgi:DNA-binding response OmpR family regulator
VTYLQCHYAAFAEVTIMNSVPSTINSEPVLVTNGGESGERDHRAVLEFAAYDYFSKPFSPRMSLARRWDVSRRQSGKPIRTCDPNRGGFDGSCLSRRARRLFDPQGDTASLTKDELVLLVTATMSE